SKVREESVSFFLQFIFHSINF
ncbi:hypothetical protein BVZ97_00117B, partial [Haemophilus influenzae]